MLSDVISFCLVLPRDQRADREETFGLAWLQHSSPMKTGDFSPWMYKFSGDSSSKSILCLTDGAKRKQRRAKLRFLSLMAHMVLTHAAEISLN